MKLYKVIIGRTIKEELYISTDNPKKIYDHDFEYEIQNVELIADLLVLN